jgi:hypothetical protein
VFGGFKDVEFSTLAVIFVMMIPTFCVEWKKPASDRSLRPKLPFTSRKGALSDAARGFLVLNQLDFLQRWRYFLGLSWE